MKYRITAMAHNCLLCMSPRYVIIDVLSWSFSRCLPILLVAEFVMIIIRAGALLTEKRDAM